MSYLIYDPAMFSILIYHYLEGDHMRWRLQQRPVKADGGTVFNGESRIVVTHQCAHGTISIFNANRSRSAAEEAGLNVIESEDLRSIYLDHSSD